MQLISYSVLSSLVLAATTVQSAPNAHTGNNVNLGRSPGHRHARAVLNAEQLLKRRSPSPPIVVPSTLKSKNKRATNGSATTTQKKCRLRPTSSTVALPTVTGIIGGSNSTTSSSSVVSSATSTSTTQSSSSAAPSQSAETYSDQWKLRKSHQGNTFFDGWNFWDNADPTHGTVSFQNRQSAWDNGLIGFTNTGAARMSVGLNDYVDNRMAIRIHDQTTFNINTLLLMDASHMPHGCGTWPAWWANGPDWPNGGEIDILEGVHDQTHNQATLHTRMGCTASSDDSHPSTGQLTNANCGVQNGDNTGCGFTDTNSDNSYGEGFNNIGGGVYAMQWVATGISVWWFPRNAIPDDITAGHPMPWTWQAPFARWGAATCNPAEFFYENNAIFDTTFCGDWAGNTWQSSGCAAKTGVWSCEEYVRGKGSNFAQAYWEVNYVKYFTQNV